MLKKIKPIFSFDKVKRIIKGNKNFVYTWTGEFFNQAAINILLIIISILSHEGALSASTKNSATSIAVIVNLATLPGFILAPIAGVIADWYNKKRILLIVSYLRFIALTIYIFISGWQNIWASYFLVFFHASLLQFAIPAEGGMIPKLVKKKNMMLANSLFSLDVYGTLSIGVVVSGVFLNVMGTRGTFILTDVLFLGAIILISKINIKEDVKNKHTFKDFVHVLRTLIHDAKKGLKYALREKVLRLSLMHLFLLQMVAIGLATLIFRIGDEVFGVSPRGAGIVILVPMVLGVFLSFILLNILGRKLKKRLLLIELGLIFAFISFSFMGVTFSFKDFLEDYLIDKVVAQISLFSLGFAVPFLLIPGQTLIYENTKAKFRGRVMGIWYAMTSSLSSLMSIVFGILADRVDNINTPIIVMSFLSLLYFFVLVFISKKLKI